jgi:hypothetical protein
MTGYSFTLLLAHPLVRSFLQMNEAFASDCLSNFIARMIPYIDELFRCRNKVQSKQIVIWQLMLHIISGGKTGAGGLDRRSIGQGD